MQADGLEEEMSLFFVRLSLTISVSVSGIQETVKLVQAAGGTCYGYVCNLCNREDVYEKANIIKEQIGKVTAKEINQRSYASITIRDAIFAIDWPDRQVRESD